MTFEETTQDAGENTATGGERPTLVLMHFLGGSGREWDEVVQELGTGYPVLRVDLPGFGDSADETGYDVSSMADFVEAKTSALRRCVLVGHSMSGKVAMVVARRAQDAGGGSRLAGLVLVGSSPAGPEPMTQEKRGGMVANLGEAHGDGANDLERARRYISKNETRDMAAAVLERAAREVLRMNRTAWVAWLMHGSKEDWRERVGVLELPALVVAGEKDSGLGPEVQRKLVLPSLAGPRFVVIEESGHLVPMEQPVQLAAELRQFVDGLTVGEEEVRSASVPTEYLEFIAGERVSDRTREVLERRMAGPEASEGVLTPTQEAVLRAMVARVVPQEGAGVDLAGYVMARLAAGKGDGWRYAVLPEDIAAYREGLDRLAAEGFTELSGGEQDEVLRGMEAEKKTARARWFEEMRADATDAYVAHPATLARLGYSGIGVGGAHTEFKGFVELRPGHQEEWEPVPVGKSGGAR